MAQCDTFPLYNTAFNITDSDFAEVLDVIESDGDTTVVFGTTRSISEDIDKLFFGKVDKEGTLSGDVQEYSINLQSGPAFGNYEVVRNLNYSSNFIIEKDNGYILCATVKIKGFNNQRVLTIGINENGEKEWEAIIYGEGTDTDDFLVAKQLTKINNDLLLLVYDEIQNHSKILILDEDSEIIIDQLTIPDYNASKIILTPGFFEVETEFVVVGDDMNDAVRLYSLTSDYETHSVGQYYYFMGTGEVSDLQVSDAITVEGAIIVSANYKYNSFQESIIFQIQETSGIALWRNRHRFQSATGLTSELFINRLLAKDSSFLFSGISINPLNNSQFGCIGEALSSNNEILNFNTFKETPFSLGQNTNSIFLSSNGITAGGYQIIDVQNNDEYIPFVLKVDNELNLGDNTCIDDTESLEQISIFIGPEFTEEPTTTGQTTITSFEIQTNLTQYDQEFCYQECDSIIPPVIHQDFYSLFFTEQIDEIRSLMTNDDAIYGSGRHRNVDTFQTYIFKLNLAGELLWKIDLQDSLFVNDIKVDDENNLYFVGQNYFQSGTNSYSIIGKVAEENNAPVLEWLKSYNYKYTFSNGNIVDQPDRNFNLILEPDKLVVHGSAFFPNLGQEALTITEYDLEGIELTRNRYYYDTGDFEDPQIWREFRRNLDGGISFFGRNDKDGSSSPGIFGYTDENLNIDTIFDINGAARIYDGIQFNQTDYIIGGQNVIAVIDTGGNIRSSQTLNGYAEIRKLYGPFLNPTLNREEFYSLNRKVSNGLSLYTISNFFIEDSIPVINWNKKLVLDTLLLTNLAADLVINKYNQFLYADSREDSISNSYLFVACFDSASCYLENEPLQLSPLTISITKEPFINNNYSAIEIGDLEAQPSLSFETIEIDPCETEENCVVELLSIVSFCNEVYLEVLLDSFENQDQIAINWSSPSIDFEFSNVDTSFIYTGELNQLIFCVEVTDGICSKQDCDTISVSQPTPPTFQNCPEDIEIEGCDLILDFGEITAIDECTLEILNSTCVRSDGLAMDEPFDIGITTITCTVTSSSGLANTCTWEVIATDITPPVCNLVETSITLDASGNFSVPGDFFDNGSSDNCSTVIFPDEITFDCTDQGQIEISIDIMDKSNNISSCSVPVEVLPFDYGLDFNSQLIGCRQFRYFPNNTDDIASYLWTVEGTSITSSAQVPGITYPENGTYTTILTATFQNGCINTKSLTFDIDQDCESCNTSFEFTSTCYEYSFTGFLNDFDFLNNTITSWTIDNISVSEEETLNYSFDGPGTYEVCFAGNGVICSAIQCEIIEIAPILPEFEFCPGNMVFELNENCDPVFVDLDPSLGFFCGDFANTNGIIIERSDNKLSEEPFDLGITEVSFLFTDQYGFSADCNFSIEVQDNISPVCITKDFNISLNDLGQAQIETFMVDNGSFDNCEIVDISLNKTLFTCEDIGVQEVTLSISDGINNSSCTALITVEDNLAPFCTLQPSEAYIDEVGNVTLELENLNYTAEDNCGIMDIEILGKEEIVCQTGENGTEYPITLVVTDNNGLTSECTQMILVRDTTSIECVPLSTEVEITELGQLVLAFLNFEDLVDNCQVASSSFQTPDATCENMGVNIVDVNSFDTGFNTTICPATITYLDRIPPTCDAPNIEIQADEEGGAIVSYNATATDPCNDDILISYSIEDNSFFECGEYVITMFAIDEHGNESSCDFEVKVTDCDACCLAPNAFQELTNQGFNVESTLVDGSECLVQIFPPNLTDCQFISQVIWGDGTIMNGQFPSDIDFIHEYTATGSYEICITMEESTNAGCFINEVCKNIEVKSDCSLITSTEESNFYNDVKLYPNPTSRKLKIDTQHKINSVQIFNTNGQLVHVILQNNTIDISSFLPGVYLLRMDLDGEIVYHKILKI